MSVRFASLVWRVPRLHVWENPSEKRPFLTVTFSRSYKDRSGQSFAAIWTR
jgi:hypothetical protein